MGNKTKCMTVPKRTKSVKRKDPGPKTNIWVVLPMGEAKLSATLNISAITNGNGSQPNNKACW